MSIGKNAPALPAGSTARATLRRVALACMLASLAAFVIGNADARGPRGGGGGISRRGSFGGGFQRPSGSPQFGQGNRAGNDSGNSANRANVQNKSGNTGVAANGNTGVAGSGNGNGNVVNNGNV